jgi:hypothetical protein
MSTKHIAWDRRAKDAEPGWYWVRVMGTDPVGWQVAECYFRGCWSLLGMPRFGPNGHAEMIRELGPRIKPPTAEETGSERPRLLPALNGRVSGAEVSDER